MPASTQSALTAGDGTTRSALLGQQADSYTLTRAVTGIVNGATGVVLLLVKTIVSYPPTSVHGDTAVWGPHSEPLDKNAWRLTVTRVEPHVFSWALDGKPKAADDTRVHHDPLGHAHARRRRPRPSDRELRQRHVRRSTGTRRRRCPITTTRSASRRSPTRARRPAAVTTIDVDFKGIKDDPPSTELYNALYRYTATPGAGGDLKYAAKRDYYPDPHPSNSALEDFTIHSRWQETGTGRTDYQLTGGDVATADHGAGHGVRMLGHRVPVYVPECVVRSSR